MPRVSTIAWVTLLVCTGWLGYDKWANRTDPEPAPIVDGVSIEGPDRVDVKELFFLTVKGRIGADTKTLNLPKSVKAMLLKDFAGNLVYACQAVESGQCLFVVADNADGKTLFGTKTVTAGTPTPPVPPPPPVPPTPPKPPTPIPGAGFRVLILEETASTNRDVVSSTALRDYLIRKCVKGPDGKTPEFRILDDDFTVEQLSTMAPNWKEAYLTAKEHSSKDKDGRVVSPQLPWLIVSDGKSGESRPLPATVDETLAVLRKYGGD